MSDRNPCSFKKACIHCNVVEIGDRPIMCGQIECKDYTPCKKCKRNCNLNELGVCAFCRKGKDSAQSEDELSEDNIEMPVQENDPDEMCTPGIPPEYLSETQQMYYAQQWDSYSGYYRDPTAYIICHYIILEEINLNYLTKMIMQRRGDMRDRLQRLKQTSISTLKDLRSQLPEKEALELSDDEKYVAMIADAYIKEKNLRSTGKVSRVFSDEAIALAPVLPHRANLQQMIENCGYTVETPEGALALLDSVPETPEELLNVFGFKVGEKYALDNGQVIDEEKLFEDGDGDDEFA